MNEYGMREINEALNMLSCEPGQPDWQHVQVLISADELEALREQARDMATALVAWEMWEADWLEDSASWEDGMPVMTEELYDRWCNGPGCLQELRNKALRRKGYYQPEQSS